MQSYLKEIAETCKVETTFEKEENLLYHYVSFEKDQQDCELCVMQDYYDNWENPNNMTMVQTFAVFNFIMGEHADEKTKNHKISRPFDSNHRRWASK
ncbi:MAG: hypothetical protein ACR2MS_12820 [Weeksellaceae bacterium]